LISPALAQTIVILISPINGTHRRQDKPEQIRLKTVAADRKPCVSVQGVGRAGWSFEPGQPLTAA
jgi:hypothetical protein